jgi:hypothetical protein
LAFPYNGLCPITSSFALVTMNSPIELFEWCKTQRSKKNEMKKDIKCPFLKNALRKA